MRSLCFAVFAQGIRTSGESPLDQGSGKDLCFSRSLFLPLFPTPAGPRPHERHTTMPMIIAVLTVEYHLHGNDSLKGKRRVADSLKRKVRNTFNVAVAEAGTQDSLVNLRLMLVSLSNDERHLRSRMDKCLAMLEAVCDEEMVYSDLEFISGAA